MPSNYKGISTILAGYQRALTVGVMESALKLENIIKTRTAPVLEGTLRGSVHTGRPKVTPASVSVEVLTGAEAADYAIVQHEKTWYTHPRGGQAKYMEAPLKQHAAEHARIVRSHIRRMAG